MLLRLFLVFATSCSFSLFAQEGDKAGEPQKRLIPREKIPPAPALSPEEALKTFKLPSEFRIEIVAAEPLVEAPVVATFDPDGRLWVVEMRGYMPDIDGHGEGEPIGRISVIEDTDGDGRMDRSTIFLDKLVMPRAVMPTRNGALVAAPPNLWFCRDTNGDGRADERTLVADDYGMESDPKLGNKANVEHASNGLLWALDNWIYSANHTTRFRNVAGLWQREPTSYRGQWGIAQDDFGRLFFTLNSDQLRGDVVPAHYLNRNRNHLDAGGANVQLLSDQSLWPARMNPGVNRGYQPGQLRADGTLATATAACGPVIYRGDQFPAPFRGNAFTCEPAGNLVKRMVLSETNGALKAVNAYDKAEFLTSTDERFRPVNLQNGPDGALYVVDMYRGIIEHRIYVTSYLREQALERGLDKPLNQGRIYRVVHAAARRAERPKLSQATSLELAGHLSHPNGWWRDTAQRLLVERADLSAVSKLKELAGDPAKPLGQLHALWTLDGLGQSDWTTLARAMNSQHAKVRSAAIRLCEPLLRTAARAKVFAAIQKLTDDPNPDVQLQVAFTLGEIRSRQGEVALASLLNRNPNNRFLRDAVISGLAGRELEFIGILFEDQAWSQPSTEREQTFRALAKCVFAEKNPERLDQLLAIATRREDPASWRQTALLDGMAEAASHSRRGSNAASKATSLKSEPKSLLALLTSDDANIRRRAQTIAQAVTWPGKPAGKQEVAAKPLTAAQKARFDAGKELYVVTCGACHQPHGNGQEGLAPPLADSEWVLGTEGRLVRIVLHGVRGAINVKGKSFQMDMPPLAALDDDQIANLLTYIRREWGHTASPVEPTTVAKIRAETEKREEAWTEQELLKVP